MPGLLNLSTAAPAPAAFTAAVNGGYSWTEELPAQQGSSHRLSSSLAAAYSPIPELIFGVQVMGRLDLFSDSSESANLLGEPRLSGRLRKDLTDALQAGIEVGARFLGQRAPDVHFASTSPWLLGLLSAKLGSKTKLASQLGVHFDNSGNVLEGSQQLSTADRFTLGAGDFAQLTWGLGVGHQWGGSSTELLAEFSGETLLGAGAPSFDQSPWRLSAGARHFLSRSWSLVGGLNLGLSRRPSSFTNDQAPLEPRLGAALTIAFHPTPPPPPPPVAIEPQVEEPAADETPEAAPEPVIARSSITGTVVDEGGRPIPDAEVSWTPSGSPEGQASDEAAQSTRTYADGRFEFKEVRDESTGQLVVSTPGFDSASVDLEAGTERNTEVILYPALPAGQVRGKVLDLAGNPVEAQITVEPGNRPAIVGADGSFELELVPGRYTLTFEHAELSTQRRVIVVEERGVIIVNIALSP